MRIMAETVRHRFVYRDGKLFYRNTPFKNQAKVGDEAGYVDSKTGYRRVGVDGKYYQVHQLVWLYHHGYLPKQLDHINRDRLDNRIENLRVVTTSVNCRNRGVRADNTSGVTGVNWYPKYQKWVARLTTDSGRKTLGYFSNKEDAIDSIASISKQHNYIR